MSMKKNYNKGVMQIDYIIAAGAFLAAFAFVVQYTVTYFDNVREVSDIITVRSEALGLMDIVEQGFVPSDWPEIRANDSSLVLLMHLNNNTLDSSGNGNNGTTDGTSEAVFANCSSGMQGRVYSGCFFDGNNSAALGGATGGLINITDSPSLNVSGNSISIEAWINFRRASGRVQAVTSRGHRIVGKGSDSLGIGSYSLGILNSDAGGTNINMDRVYFVVSQDASAPVSLNDTFAAGQWHHIAATFNGTMKLIYVNGVLQGNESSYGGTVNTSASNVYIGASTKLNSMSFFNGTLDEVAIYNRTLSDSEVREHYQRGLRRLGFRGSTYRFTVIVNNTQKFYVNNSPQMALNNESVLLNFSEILPGADVNSVVIYNETNGIVDQYVHGMNVSFTLNLSSGQAALFTVYASAGTVFPPRSAPLIVGNNNMINETVLAAEKIPVIQYNKLVHINQSNYTALRESLDIENDFNILVEDADANTTLVQFGKEIPKRGNVVAMRRYALFQNATAAIKNGRITMRIW